MAADTARSPYDVLGIAPGATAEAIKKAYRRQAQQHHPDKHGDDAAAHARFQEITAAYTALTQPPADPLVEVWDLFAHMFTPPHRTARRVEIVLTLDEVQQAVHRTLSLPDGQVAEVRLPPGVDHGERYGLFRQGQLLPGWEAVIRMAPHPRLARQGADLLTPITLSYAQLVLGGPVAIEGLNETITGELAPGLAPGHRLRLVGHGLPMPHGGRGDLYVDVVLELPTTLTAVQRKAIESMDKKLHPKR